MSINKLIIESLKDLNIPVAFQNYQGESSTYITFNNYLEQGEAYSDDFEEETGIYIQVDLWSKYNLEKTKNDVIKLLTKNNFIKQSITNLYESDTKIFHIACRFFFCVENKED